MKKRPRFPLRRIVRDVLIAAGGAAVLATAYLLGALDGHHATRAAHPPQQQASVQLTPARPAAAPAVAPAIDPKPAVAPPVPVWQRNAVRAAIAAGRPVIVLVIDDMGLDRKRSARAVALPAPVTLAYLPYAADLPAQTAAARAAGHELLVHVPMEPDSAGENPGPRAMRVTTAEREILAELDWMLGRFGGYVGINNHMGSRFTRDAARMAIVLAEVQRRGLLFLDSRTSARTVAGDTARQLGVPLAERDVFLDAEETPAAVRARLAELEARALAQGRAIAIGHPKDVTLAALEQWLPEARTRFAFAPVSAVVTALPPRHASR